MAEIRPLADTQNVIKHKTATTKAQINFQIHNGYGTANF